MGKWVQLEFDFSEPSDFIRAKEYRVFNRMDTRVQIIYAYSMREALVMAYANSIGRGDEQLGLLMYDYVDEITYDFCRIRLGDWCISL